MKVYFIFEVCGSISNWALSMVSFVKTIALCQIDVTYLAEVSVIFTEFVDYFIL